MSIEFDFSDIEDFDPETLDRGNLPKPGKCQLLVTGVTEKGEKGVLVTHEIIAHEDPTQVGKESYNYFNRSGKGVKRSFLFALATGITTKQDLAEAAAVGRKVALNFKSAFNKTYCGILVADTYDGKPSCRVQWTFLHNNHPDAADFPKSSEFTEISQPNSEKGPSLSGATSGDDIPF